MEILRIQKETQEAADVRGTMRIDEARRSLIESNVQATEEPTLENREQLRLDYHEYIMARISLNNRITTIKLFGKKMELNK